MSTPRPGGASLRPAIAAAAVLLAQQVAARATRDAFFLSVFDVTALPTMTASAAVVSLAATILASRALARLSPARLLPLALAFSVVAFLGEFLLALVWPRPAAVAVYLHHAVVGAILVSGFWSLITEQFDPHAAKHAMGPIGAGASLGGVLGGFVTWVAAAAHLSPQTMLLVLAAITVAGVVTVRRLSGGARARVAAAAAPVLAGRSALDTIRRVPVLGGLALLVVLTSFLDSVLDYLLAAAATSSFGTGASLMSFFALFHAGTGLLSLLTQSLLVRPLLQRLGPAWTLAAPSVFVAAGAAAAAVAPRLGAIIALRGGHGILRNSAFRSGYELLYTPLPEHQKRPTKVLIDIAGERVGAIVGSLAVTLVLLLVPAVAPRLLPAIAAVVAVLTLGLTPLLRRGYVAALATSLRSGAASLEPPDIVDPATLMTLASVHLSSATLGRRAATGPAGEVPSGDPVIAAIADLRSDDPGRILNVLGVTELDARLVPHVIPLLARDGLFEKVATALREAAPRCTGQLVDALLDPDAEPMIRRRVARVLKNVPTQRAADGLLIGLDDVRFDLRYRCAQALLRIRAHNAAVAVPSERLLEIAAREAAHAGESPRHLEHCFTLLGIVLERGPLDSAYRALQSNEPGLRGTALEYLENVLPGTVRDKLWPHLGAPITAPSGRSTEQIRDDLLRSTTRLRRPSSSRGLS